MVLGRLGFRRIGWGTTLIRLARCEAEGRPLVGVLVGVLGVSLRGLHGLCLVDLSPVTKLLLDHVIRQNDEKRPELAVPLGLNLSQDELELIR